MNNTQNETQKHSAVHTGTKLKAANDEIDLLELVQTIWAGKWLIIAITAIFAVGSVLYVISQPNIYKAEAKLAPTKESQGGMGALGGQLGGLASLAGINMPRGQVDNSQLAQEIIKSRAFLTDFVERRGILPDLMAVESWNQASGEVVYASDIYDIATQSWVREVKSPQQVEPSSWEYVKELQRIISMSEGGYAGILSLSVEHISPNIAKQWVDWLIEDINNEMRRRDVEEAQSSIAFIEREMATTQLANTHQVYATLLEQQTQTIMLANVRPEYVFRVIDPAVVPEQKAKPNRTLTVVLGIILGGILGVFVALVHVGIQNHRKP